MTFTMYAPHPHSRGHRPRRGRYPEPRLNTVTLDFCGHHIAPTCPAHGCPWCRQDAEHTPWLDAWEACSTCTRARASSVADHLARNPELGCELATCTHCASCVGACSTSGVVCRRCGLCVDCAATELPGSCTAWTAEQLETLATMRDVCGLPAKDLADLDPIVEHQLLDTSTGRWSR